MPEEPIKTVKTPIINKKSDQMCKKEKKLRKRKKNKEKKYTNLGINDIAGSTRVEQEL